jgi:hypothetical protein
MRFYALALAATVAAAPYPGDYESEEYSAPVCCTI